MTFSSLPSPLLDALTQIVLSLKRTPEGRQQLHTLGACLISLAEHTPLVPPHTEQAQDVPVPPRETLVLEHPNDDLLKEIEDLQRRLALKLGDLQGLKELLDNDLAFQLRLENLKKHRQHDGWFLNGALTSKRPDVLLLLEALLGNLQLALTLLEQAVSNERYEKAELLLIAEAQAALRSCAAQFSSTDRDQNHCHRLLLTLTNEHNIYLDRFMRLNSNPDPLLHAQLNLRLQQALSSPPEAKPKIQPRRGAPTERTYSPTVLQAQELLKNKTLLLVGGQGTEADLEALRKAFCYSNVQWLHTQEGALYSDIKIKVEARQADVVVLLTRFIRHVTLNLVSDHKHSGRIYLRAPGGYNPEQIAHQLIEQASLRLEEQA